eukprot:238593_1
MNKKNILLKPLHNNMINQFKLLASDIPKFGEDNFMKKCNELRNKCEKIDQYTKYCNRLFCMVWDYMQAIEIFPELHQPQPIRDDKFFYKCLNKKHFKKHDNEEVS